MQRKERYLGVDKNWSNMYCNFYKFIYILRLVSLHDYIGHNSPASFLIRFLNVLYNNIWFIREQFL